MEFADLILSPKTNFVCLTLPFNRKIEGTLCLTGHQIIVSSKTEEASEVWLYHSNIDYIDRKQCSNVQQGGCLIIKCKDLRILQLDLFNLDDFTNVAVSLERLINIDDQKKFYPFFYRALYPIIEDGWTAFRPETEFHKLVTTFGDEWRISYVNQDFSVCSTYPSAVVIPSSIDDETLIVVAGFRDGGRFPVLSYRHKNGSVLMRSSQPLTGATGKRCKEDEKLLNSLLGVGKRGFIFDTRSTNSAQNARAKGGGFENEIAYPQWRRVHKPLEKVSNLLDSFTKLMEGLNDKTASVDRYLSKIYSSDWLSHVKNSLNCACLVAQCLEQENSSILIHDGESLDYPPLVCSLTQLILNPDTRTIRGLEALIEREWLQAGYPFPLRHQRFCYSSQNQRLKSHAPTFLLFLDCLYQIFHQFSFSFEFNINFLITLFEHSYSSQFGTFLGNCDAERERMKLSQKTTSLWSYINRPEQLQDFLNPFYEPNSGILWPSVAPVSIKLWDELYLRWILDQTGEKSAHQGRVAIKSEYLELKQMALKLRKQLADLELQCVDAGLLF